MRPCDDVSVDPSARTRGADGSGGFCGWCGGDSADGEHARCVHRLATIDPPRYCTRCARRMVVQVSPTGWTATCSRHGMTGSAVPGGPDATR